MTPTTTRRGIDYQAEPARCMAPRVSRDGGPLLPMDHPRSIVARILGRG
jgi:hypothetical protein